MTEKELAVSIDAPIRLCSLTFESTKDLHWDYSLIRVEPSQNHFRFRKAQEVDLYPLILNINLKEISSHKTEAVIRAEMFGRFFVNVLTVEIYDFINEFKKLIQSETLRTRREMDAGRMCPTCYDPMPAGTAVCPNDGTPITQICPRCHLLNSLSIRFCSNCGQLLSNTGIKL